ncbi:GlcG/HbpS family heme-binding protein [Actinomycetospora termitidis]|uniref:Heme-binding protein n=1 Tax=Actinomycetospora termitidis TaxID=3053470 RepID=A0ABT7M6P2_9PSEU|nr:heme-binding protein [Actinomycetospora sp. Odt1-22]MDL5156116.1 heme-binding protein [Actinomycetospora sp. Odt1-22]
MSATRARTVRSITAEFAQELIDAAAAKAAEIGVPMVISVVDHDGTLKAFRRMDGAPLLSVEIAQNKAYTAAAFGISTDAWHEFIKEDEPLRLSIVHTDRLVTFGGGYPVTVDGEMVGGIGVSGGHYTHDMQVASGALEALGVSGAS